MIPGFQDIFKPVLQQLSNGEIRASREVLAMMAKHFNLTDEELAEKLPRGRGELFENRLGWSMTYLKKAMLLQSPKRAQVCITERGKQLLEEDPPVVDVPFLKQRFPEFKEWLERKSEDEEDEEEDVVDEVAASDDRDALLIERFEKMREGKRCCCPDSVRKAFSKRGKPQGGGSLLCGVRKKGSREKSQQLGNHKRKQGASA